MARFMIKSRFVVSVEIEVAAEDKDEANAMFDSIGVTAKLFDVDEGKYDVLEDAIEELYSTEIEQI